MSPGADPTHEPAVRAFCSYAHKDNDSFSRTVEYLVEDFRSLHEAETGRILDIFFDRNSIGWGQDLRGAISDSVENATFFIPVITARYFQSSWCRDELLSFYGKCRALGVTELILPLVIAGKSQISEDSEDELVRIIARVRYIDWTNIWQHGRGSAAWNLGITELVQRLAERQEPIETRLAARALGGPSVDSPGQNSERVVTAPDSSSLAEQLERFGADGEPVLDAVAAVVGDLRKLLGDLRYDFDRIEIVDQYAVRSALDKLGGKFAARGHDLERSARAALRQLVEFDATVRGVIRATSLLGSPEQLSRLRTQVDGLRDSALRLGQLIRDVNSVADVLRQYGDASIGLRVALSPARAGLQSIRDIAHILDGWASLEF
jgi:TIR domain